MRVRREGRDKNEFYNQDNKKCRCEREFGVGEEDKKNDILQMTIIWKCCFSLNVCVRDDLSVAFVWCRSVQFELKKR